MESAHLPSTFTLKLGEFALLQGYYTMQPHHMQQQAAAMAMQQQPQLQQQQMYGSPSVVSGLVKAFVSFTITPLENIRVCVCWFPFPNVELEKCGICRKRPRGRFNGQ